MCNGCPLQYEEILVDCGKEYVNELADERRQMGEKIEDELRLMKQFGADHKCPKCGKYFRNKVFLKHVNKCG